MRRFVTLSLLTATLFGYNSVHGGMLTPAEQNLMVAEVAPTCDLMDPAIMFEIPGTNLFRGNGTIGDGSWQLTLSGMYQDIQVGLTYSGLNDPATGIVSWSGRGSFGAETWTTSGTATFTADNGLIWHQTGNIGIGGGNGDGFVGGYQKDGSGEVAKIMGGGRTVLIDLSNLFKRQKPPPPDPFVLQFLLRGDQPPGPTGPVPYIPVMGEAQDPKFRWETTLVRNEFSLDEPVFEWVEKCIPVPEPSSLGLAAIAAAIGLACAGARRVGQRAARADPSGLPHIWG